MFGSSRAQHSKEGTPSEARRAKEGASGEGHAVQQLLVGYYERRQSEQRVERRLQRRKLRLRESTVEPQPARRGIDFVGWTTFWNHRRPRGRTVANCGLRLRHFARRELQPLWAGVALRLDTRRRPQALPLLRAIVASYSGHLRHGAACRKWVAVWERHRWLRAFFEFSLDDPWRVHARWPERAVGGVRFSTQYGRFIRRAGDRSLVFCRVGTFVQFYGPQRTLATRVLRLARVAMARGGFAFSVGFPLRLLASYVARGVRAGYTVVEVRESHRLCRRCASRQVTAVWTPRPLAAPGRSWRAR